MILDEEVHGFYRFYYANYTPIIRKLHTDYISIPMMSRARIVEDIFTHAKLGKVPYGTVFYLCEYLVNETEYSPFLIFNNHMQRIFLLLRKHPDAIYLQVIFKKVDK